MESAFIEKEWCKFCLACFGNISDQQYIDLRRTFYRGCRCPAIRPVGSFGTGRRGHRK